MGIVGAVAPAADAVAAPGRGRVAAQAALVAVGFALLACAAIVWTREYGRVAALWPANGFLLACVLRAPASRWLPIGAFAAGAALIVNLGMGDAPAIAAALAGCNVGEVFIAAFATRALLPMPPDPATPRHVAILAGIGLVAPLAPALAAATALGVDTGGPSLALVGDWYLADALGLLLVTPLCLTAFEELGRARSKRPRRTARAWIEAIALFGAVASVTALVFAQSWLPLLFLVHPFVLLAVFRRGSTGATIAVTIVTAGGVLATALGSGPMTLVAADQSARLHLLQFFLATVYFSALPVAAALAQRRRLETDLHTSRALYRSLVDTMPDAVFQTDLAGRYIFLSPAWTTITGHPVENSLGVSSLVVVADEERDAASTHIARLLAREVDEVRTELRFWHADGGLRWGEASYRLVFDADSAPLGSIGSFRDITERRADVASLRESERLFRTLAEMSPAGIYRTDAAGLCTFVNPTWCRIAGLSALDAAGHGWTSAVASEDRAELTARFEVAVARTALFGAEFRFRRSDGSIAWVLSAAAPELDDAGACVGFIGVIVDVTQLKSTQAELVEARDEARKLADAKSLFLATMSHELRTPMTGVLGMIDLLRDEADPVRRDHCFDALDASAKVMMEVVDGVLDFSKMEAGHLAIEEVAFDLPALIGSVVDLFRHAASVKGLDLVREVGVAPGTTVRGDPTRVRQVLANLVGNAIKFTNRGRVTVQVHAQPRAGSERGYWFGVWDEGIGIAAADQQRIFEPFEQVDQSTTRRFGGSGLGLSICKRLVEAMDGTIGVASRPGEGAMFWFQLTLADAPTDALAVVAPAPAVMRSGLSVLLAEDNEVNRLLVTSLLARMGHIATCVANGRLALDAARGGGFDVILMDMQMPVMDGRDATRAIRALPGAAGRVPIIALTADTSPERRHLYGELGLTDFLAKPLKAASLGAVLDGLAVGAAAAPEPRGGEAVGDDKLDELTEMLGEGTVAALLAALVGDADAIEGELAAAVEDGDADGVARAAHALKGAAGSVGAARVAAAAIAFEREPAERHAALMIELGAAIAELRRFVDARAGRPILTLA